MTKKEFMENVAEDLRSNYLNNGDYRVRTDIFTKNNDTLRYGIGIRKQEAALSPTIYVDQFYEDYLNKKITVHETAKKIQQVLAQVEEHAIQYTDLSVDFDSCSDKIIYRLISMEMNSHLLEGIPYIPFLNLAIVFSIACNMTPKGFESLRITNELIAKWGISTKELMNLAEENTQRLFPVKTDSLTNIVFNFMGVYQSEFCEFLEDNEPQFPMIILTNTFGINGATSMIYPGIIQEIAAKYDSNLYILPSSIHEVIIIPDESAGELSELSEMVLDINSNHVDREEVLSNNAYFYDRSEKRFIF